MLLRKRQTRSDLVFDVINNLVMILFLLVIAYPLFFILIASISDPTLVYNGKVLFVPKGITFLGYSKIFHDDKILIGYMNSIMYTLVGTIVNVVLTVTSGYALSRRDLKGRRIILAMLTFTMFFNGGMIPTYLLVKKLGLLYTFWAMIIPNAVSVFNIIIARTYYESNIPYELYEAASIDGCGNLKFFFKIVLPLSNALTAVMVLFYVVGHWNSFFNALIYLNDQKMYPLQLILRNILIVNQSMDNSMLEDVREAVEKQKAAELVKYGVIVVSSLPVLILYPFIQKYFVKGIMIGSVKG